MTPPPVDPNALVARVKRMFASRDAHFPHPDYDTENVDEESQLSYADLRQLCDLVESTGRERDEAQDQTYCPRCGSCGMLGCCGFRCHYEQEHREEYLAATQEASLLFDENIALRAERDALTEDAERLDYLEAHGGFSVERKGATKDETFGMSMALWGRGEPMTVREAIDAARASEGTTR